jgi:5-carboxyvanillate decarboxylase
MARPLAPTRIDRVDIKHPNLGSPARPQQVPYLRIATEEAFAPREMIDIYRKLLERGDADAGFRGLMGFYMSSPSERAQHIMRCLTDLDQLRLQHMDAAGVDKAVLALTAPGVQVMDKGTGWPKPCAGIPRAWPA